MTTPFGPQLIGETEKTINALLIRHLEGVLTKPEWVTWRIASMLDDSIDRVRHDVLVAATPVRSSVTSRPTTPPLPSACSTSSPLAPTSCWRADQKPVGPSGALRPSIARCKRAATSVVGTSPRVRSSTARSASVERRNPPVRASG
jgi:hypothetical protein